MANRLTELMQRPDRGARLAQNVLTRAFRDMLTQLDIDEGRLTILTEVYLRDPKRRKDAKIDQNKLANDRGNLKKELEKDEFTIKVFLKLMKLLRLKDFEINFKAKRHDGYELNEGKGLTYRLDLDVDDFDLDLESVDVDDAFMKSFHEEVDRILTERQVERGKATPISNAENKGNLLECAIEGECKVIK